MLESSKSPTAEVILRDFRDRRITFAEFERQMRPWLEMDFRGAGMSIRYRQPLRAQVPITPGHVRQALADYAAGKLSEQELNYWASMLDMLTEFGPGPDVSDDDADRLEPMWDVLIRLTDCQIFGALTPEAMSQYDAKLRQLESALSEGAV